MSSRYKGNVRDWAIQRIKEEGFVEAVDIITDRDIIYRLEDIKDLPEVITIRR